MIGPWVMAYTVIYFGVRVASAFGAKFPNGPILIMFIVEKPD